VDALSRYPVFAAQEEELPVDTLIECLQAREDSSLRLILESIDDEYKEIAAALKAGDSPNRQRAGSLSQFRDKAAHLPSYSTATASSSW
jgi:hypothetical protein